MRTSFAAAAGLLAVASAGKTTTITDTVDVTVISCAPTVTNCPYGGGPGGKGDHTWSDWDGSATTTTSTPADVTSTTSYSWDPNHTWSDWADGVSSTTSKPVSPDTTTTYPWDPNHTWSDWSDETTTSTKPVSPDTTTYPWDPNHTWSDWSDGTSSKPVSPDTTTYPADPNHTWSDWVSGTTLATTGTPVSAATAPYGTPSWSIPVAAASTGAGNWSDPSSTGVKPATFTGAANYNAGSFALAGLAAAAALVLA